MNDLKKSFFHKFSNGNTCSLMIDLNGENAKAKCNWERPPEWPVIEREFRTWAQTVVHEFTEEATLEELLQIAKLTFFHE